MRVSVQYRILAAIVYADIFDYPLTAHELIQWIPSGKSLSPRLIEEYIRLLIKKHRIGYTPPFIYLLGRKKTIQFRIERLAESLGKWKQIWRTAKILQYIPTISLVGVTGSLAVNNADKEDDIDLLIIAKHNTLWITRFLATVIVEIFAKRRHPADIEVKNAVCLNMFFTDRSLQIPNKEHGWYTAHEVLQMVPVWERNHMYTKYLQANRWVGTWFKFAYEVQKLKQIPKYSTRNKHIKWYHLLNRPMKYVQLWYMRRRRTTETVSDTILRFHPNDARIWIRKSFLTKLRQYKVPLDKRFNQI
jgi:predicted nucleotidyltransferase